MQNIRLHCCQHETRRRVAVLAKILGSHPVLVARTVVLPRHPLEDLGLEICFPGPGRELPFGILLRIFPHERKREVEVFFHIGEDADTYDAACPDR